MSAKITYDKMRHNECRIRHENGRLVGFITRVPYGEKKYSAYALIRLRNRSREGEPEFKSAEIFLQSFLSLGEARQYCSTVFAHNDLLSGVVATKIVRLVETQVDRVREFQTP